MIKCKRKRPIQKTRAILIFFSLCTAVAARPPHHYLRHEWIPARKKKQQLLYIHILYIYIQCTNDLSNEWGTYKLMSSSYSILSLLSSWLFILVTVFPSCLSFYSLPASISYTETDTQTDTLYPGYCFINYSPYLFRCNVSVAICGKHAIKKTTPTSRTTYIDIDTWTS